MLAFVSLRQESPFSHHQNVLVGVIKFFLLFPNVLFFMQQWWLNWLMFETNSTDNLEKQPGVALRTRTSSVYTFNQGIKIVQILCWILPMKQNVA